MSNEITKNRVASVRAYLASIEHKITQTQGYEVVARAQGVADANVLASTQKTSNPKKNEETSYLQQELVESVQSLLTAFEDTLSGYTSRELHKPPKHIIAQARRVLEKVVGADAVESDYGCLEDPDDVFEGLAELRDETRTRMIYSAMLKHHGKIEFGDVNDVNHDQEIQDVTSYFKGERVELTWSVTFYKNSHLVQCAEAHDALGRKVYSHRGDGTECLMVSKNDHSTDSEIWHWRNVRAEEILHQYDFDVPATVLGFTFVKDGYDPVNTLHSIVTVKLGGMPHQVGFSVKFSNGTAVAEKAYAYDIKTQTPVGHKWSALN